MRIDLDVPGTCVRSWRADDAPSLALHANSRAVWRNLRDQFPHPYGLADAEAFLCRVLASPVETIFAIDAGGRAVGGIGFHPREDVERLSAEVGYWLGESWWGRGIATAALRSVGDLAFEHELRRLFAYVFEWNPASCRVLEKAGFVREGRLRRAVYKDGALIDQFLYARVR
jgi:RimJ/RimL family protein N-acetyltransferase